ncbi:SagB/ThcOx family dehydrogenase [Actinomyces bovis]
MEVPGIYMLESSPWLVEGTSRAGKQFRHLPSFQLPDPGAYRDSITLGDALASRRTPIGEFASGTPATDVELSWWCWAADGYVRHVSAFHTGHTAPSGGALRPRDLYVSLRDGIGPSAGLYYYEPQSHTLFQVGTATPTELGSATPEEKLFKNVDAVFIISAFPLRSRFKYGIRATRFALMEAGHVAQNLLLGVLATGHVALPMGGFFDDELADLLGLDGVHEFPVYALLVGRPEDVVALHDAKGEVS